MGIRNRLLVSTAGAVLFFGLFFMTPGCGRTRFINECLRDWHGRSDDWVSLAIALGVTLGVAVVIWEYNRPDSERWR